MIRYLIFTLFIICVSLLPAKSQKIMELGIKPTEFSFQNYETNFAIGNKKTRYGFFVSYRPSTQDSGQVKALGSGMFAGYWYPNMLYSSYTIGLYQKTYLSKDLDIFLETDIFYRNWSFENKFVEFNTENTLEGSYSFKGLRSENINVYGFKLLLGYTFVFSQKERLLIPFVDMYFGFGIRYREVLFETFDGFVNENFYNYKKEEHFMTRFSPQLGFKIGLLIASCSLVNND